MKEVETKKTTLEAEMATALEAVKVLTPATPEFDEAYTRYLGSKASLAKIPDELIAAKLSENSEAIAVAGTQIADAIAQLAAGLKIEELLGTPLIALRYAVDAEGKGLVVFNPIMKLKSTTGAKGKGTGRTVIVDSAGERLSLTKFVLAHATEAEKSSPDYKYPHTRVDSKPKFEEFCKAHSLTGCTYEVASNEPTAEAPTPAAAPEAPAEKAS